jgi:ATP:ADP antiporter, AAA family
VIADYIAYSLGEVIFLDVLKLQFPNPTDYCNYMGTLALWGGIVTFVSSVFITPFVLQRYRWLVAALVTPICLLLTEGLFFIFLRAQSVGHLWFGWTEAEWIMVVVVLGSIQYCICRGAKYTLFDASKEIAFVWMPDFQRMKGKLVVDGLCARLGRGGASMLSIGLIKISGGVLGSALVTGFIALGMALSWLISTFKLGQFIDGGLAKDLVKDPVSREKYVSSSLNEV